MKNENMVARYLVAVYMLAVCLPAFSQDGHVSLLVRPITPTSADSVSVVSRFPLGGCTFDRAIDISILFGQVVITENIFRQAGYLLGDCTETVSVGKLSPGQYNVVWIRQEGPVRSELASATFMVSAGPVAASVPTIASWMLVFLCAALSVAACGRLRSRN